MTPKGKGSDIQRLGYRPPASYQLDVEVFPVAELRRRVATDHLRLAHRIEFHMLICVTRGECTHTIDFTPIRCRPGSLLTLRPAQAQQFDNSPDWDGWLVIFCPEFLLPLQTTAALADLQMVGNLEVLPKHLELGEEERQAVASGILQMHKDACLQGPSAELHALLRHQLYALLLRLHLVHGRQESQSSATSSNLQRFKRFKVLLEKNFASQRQVSAYAGLLGCSEKSLSRATLEVAGVTAKAYIAARINLEAKRLLAHTALPVTLIADRVGFDEPTNFVKFFKREAGCSPGEFRHRHREDISQPGKP